MHELFANRILWTTLAANAVCQLLKVPINYWTKGRWDWSRVWETGGMPSSHSSMVTTLAMSFGLAEGWNNGFFTIATCFALYVIFDAARVRRQAGMHADHLNRLKRSLKHLLEPDPQLADLEVLLGHTYPQVFVGILIGLGVSEASFLIQ